MSNALFERIVKMAKTELPHLELCTVSGFGEFSMDRGWAHKLAFARRSFQRVHVVTNLSLIDDEGLISLRALATEVRVSVGGVDDETYRRVHRPPANVSAEMIQTRIRKLTSLPGKDFTIGVTCCELAANHEQIPRWIERFEPLVDHLEVWKPHNWVTGQRFRSVDDSKVASCGRPAAGPLQVQVDGTMNVCCFDYNGLMVIGDLKTQSFAEILEGPTLSRIRRLHAAGQADELPLCAVCDQREPPQRRQTYLRHCSRADRAERILRTSSGMEQLPAIEPAGRK